MAVYSQKDLKKNEVTEIVYVAAEWIRNNRQTFYSLAGIFGGIILFMVFFFTRYFIARERVSDKLSVGQALIYHKQMDRGLKMLDEVINQYSTTPSAYMARLTKAEYLINQRKYPEAKAIVSDVITNGKPDAIVPLAYPFLGNIQEDTQDYKGAVKTYNDFLARFPEHFLAADILSSLARVYELSGNFAQAKASYQKLAASFKGSKWEELAKMRLSYINR